MKTHEILITDEIFTGLRQDFNMIMRKTLNTMQSKGSDGGEVNLKLKISLSHDLLELDSSIFGGGTKEYINPKFEHKVTSVIQVREELTGKIEGNYKLNTEEGKYYIQEIENSQCSFFDEKD